MKKIILAVITILFATLSNAQLKIGNKAPEIILPTQTETQLKLSDLKGKVVLIDFWASWCGPCRKNNPHLVKLYEKFKGESFEILSVSIDESKNDWLKAIKKDKLTWLQVIDTKGWEAPTAIAYFVEAIPSSFLIDKDGIIRAIDMEGIELENMIKELLKK